LAYSTQAWDLNTNTLITELTTGGLEFNERINDAGEFEGSLSLTDPQASKFARIILGLGGIPFKFLVTANNNTLILFAGIVWHTDLGSESTTLDLKGKALTSYYTQVVAAKAYVAPIQPTLLLAAVVNDLEAKPKYGIGLRTALITPSSPAPMTPAYTLSQHVTAAQIMADVTASITPGTGGVDYVVRHAMVNGVPQHTLTIYAPRAGVTQKTSQLTVWLDNATDWTWPTENTTGGNNVIVVGAGSGSSQPTATATVTTPVGGYGQPPGMDLVLQYNQVSSKTQLQGLANGAIQSFGHPLATPTVTLPANYPPLLLGSFSVGDDVRVRSSVSPRFPNGLDQWWRIVAYKVQIPDGGLATYTLTLNPPPIF
jgi:hypothetical protein